MGVIQKPVEKKRDSKSLPESLRYIYDEYRRIKFAITQKEETMVLYPRAALTYSELDSYFRLSNSNFKPWEISLIMDIDAIFEGRDHG